ncbi:CAP domain-containing protein [Lentibacillus sp. L22]
MRLIRAFIAFIILFVLALGGFYLLAKNDLTPDEAVHDMGNMLDQKKSMTKSKSVPESKLSKITVKGDLFQWVGKTKDQLTENFGKPVRIDKSAYGYDWWVYTDKQDQYIQFGVEDDKVTTVYATGDDLSIDPIYVGQSYDAVNEQFSFKKDMTYKDGVKSYTFHLNDEDMKMRPLAKIADNLFVQCYFDTFTDKLSSIRILTADSLLKQRAYQIEYRGGLPDVPELSDKEWQEVESGMEQQIFDITNVMRSQFDKSKVAWNKTVSEVAFLHSEDMSKNDYFSHYSKNGNGLKERLAEKKVHYATAGENIAAQYPDAPAAMEGWLNSEGHRKALLNDDYTHLGVGVYHLYYTQNFIEIP